MSLLQLAKKARQINIKNLALSTAQKNSGLIDNAVRDQLTDGKAGDGANVGIYKSPYYARRKSTISSAPFGVVDLKLKGTLYKGINTKISVNEYDTGSSVEHSKYQVDRYGKRIYELQKENSEDIKFKNSVELVQAYSKLLGL